MICKFCNTERRAKDFMKNQLYCYRCEYHLKVQKFIHKQRNTNVVCRTCGIELIKQENIHRRQRTIFCSEECAKEGHQNKIDTYWTNQIRGQ